MNMDIFEVVKYWVFGKFLLAFSSLYKDRFEHNKSRRKGINVVFIRYQ